MAFVKG
ncbi:hypothetical protein PENANT_c069G10724 [Penicillium antarcticum]|nr:hypothetical protein PENANT_c069G10724 [Penicillium antarcticum]